MRRQWFKLVVMLAVSAMIGGVAVAQQPEPGTTALPADTLRGGAPVQVGPGGGDTYGISAWIVQNFPPSAFHAYSTSLGYTFYSDGYIAAQSSDTFRYFETTAQLPAGAAFWGYTGMYYDTAGTPGGVTLWLWSRDYDVSNPTSQTEIFNGQSSGTGGYGGGYVQFASPYVWRNTDPVAFKLRFYNLRVHLGTATTATKFGGVTFWYKLQISPAPATATFLDVPTSYIYFRHIEALAASGITAGCGGGNYCPTNPVTRGEMAVFFAKALGLQWTEW